MISQDDDALEFDRPDDVEVQRRRTRMLLRVGLVLGVVLFLACLAVVLVIRAAQRTVTHDPDVVREIAQRIESFDVPPAFLPDRALEIRVPGRDRPLVAWAHFFDKQSDSALVVAEVGDSYAEADMGKTRELVERSLREQGIPVRKIVPEQNKPLEIDLDKGPEMVNIIVGRAPGKTQRRIQSQIAFRGRRGDRVVVLLSVDAAQYPEAAVAQMLRPLLARMAAYQSEARP